MPSSTALAEPPPAQVQTVPRRYSARYYAYRNTLRLKAPIVKRRPFAHLKQARPSPALRATFEDLQSAVAQATWKDLKVLYVTNLGEIGIFKVRQYSENLSYELDEEKNLRFRFEPIGTFAKMNLRELYNKIALYWARPSERRKAWFDPTQMGDEHTTAVEVLLYK